MAAPSQTRIGETKHQFLALKKVKGINTQPSREAVGLDEFAWIENFMPIGDAFIPAVAQVGNPVATVTGTINYMRFANIGTVNYQICFTAAGGAQAVNLGNNSVVTIAAAGTFTGPHMDQWKSERILIADDSNGYYSWDGSLFHSPGSLATISVTTAGSAYTSTPTIGFSGGGGITASAVAALSGGGISSITITSVGSGFTAAPTVTFTGGTTATTGLATASAFIMPTGQQGQALAVYSGRTWISNQRTVTETAPGTWFDFNTADAAGSTTITEGFLRNRFYALWALDNYLYLFGDAAIFVIGDLKVSGSITTFSLTALSATTGSTLPNTITSLERAIIFMNKYGVYALYGASVQKISKPLDGIFPLIDFSQTVSAGLVQINNILCYAVSFTYSDHGTNRAIQAVYFSGKWFLTSQGALAFISPAEINGTLSMWGTTGSDMRQLYSNTTQTIATTLQTGLYDMGNAIFDKQVIRAGLEYTAPAATTVNLRVDTENTAESQVASGTSTLLWYNNSNVLMTWQNNAAQTITWLASGFLLFNRSYSVKGKYLGFTTTSNSPGVILNGHLLEFEQRASW